MNLRLPEPVFGALALLVLVLGAMAILAAGSGPFARELRSAEVRIRIRTWWMAAGLLGLALLIDRRIAVVAIGLLSFVAFKEFLTLAPTRRAHNKVLLWAYLAIPVQYVLAGNGWYGAFVVFIPVYAFLLLPLRMVLLGESRGFLRGVGILHWGLMTTVFCISHLAFLVVMPDPPGFRNAGATLLFYVVALTQLNETVQHMVSARWGRHPVLAGVRPGLSVEGMAAGIVATVLLALAMGPWFTRFSILQTLIAGLLVGVSGLVGSVAVRAVTRDIGVTEQGYTIPGHGALLERLDALIFSAPLFFHLLYAQVH